MRLHGGAVETRECLSSVSFAADVLEVANPLGGSKIATADLDLLRGDATLA